METRLKAISTRNLLQSARSVLLILLLSWAGSSWAACSYYYRPTTTQLTTTSNPSMVGTGATLLATVSGGVPGGTVIFKEGALVLGTANVVSGVATLPYSFSTSGAHVLTAQYSGAQVSHCAYTFYGYQGYYDIFQGSTSTGWTHTVIPANTTTTLTTSSNPSVVGAGVTLTANVTGGYMPGGTVTFKDGATNLGVGTLTNGTATFSYHFTTAGTHSLTAVYGGNENNVTSTSAAVNQTVNATVPGAPTIGTATRGNASATVSFTAPSSNGGSAITRYTATSSSGNTGTCTAPCTSITVTGLTNGTAYTFTVKATNAVGTGAASAASNPVTPMTVPGAPTIGTATGGNASATVAFTAPSSNGGSAITSYTATSSTGNITGTCTAPCTSITVTGLTNGTAYTFTVKATNAVGTGAASVASNPVTPATVPGAPTIGTATRGDRSATVTFTAPSSDGGSAITSYTATSNSGLWATCTASPCTVYGLTNGSTYTFTVKATNAVGTGAASAVSDSVTPATVPGAPTGVSATRGNASATVAFTAPASNGSPITGYTATSNSGLWATCTASPCTVSGLTNGTPYTFTVTATNAVGTGSASAPSLSVTPVSVPDAPTGVTATGGDASATVTFTAPASNGGSVISHYTATSNIDSITGTCWTPCSSITVAGLTNGTAYTFTVTATNYAVGTGPASAPSNSVTPMGAPDAPTGVTATGGNTSATVSFTAPGDGGSGITSYTATSSPGNFTSTCTASPCTVSGLTNGATYTFTVTATNAVGTSSASAPSNSVTLALFAPDAPTNVHAVAGLSQAIVTFTAPVNNGGSAVTGYTVSSTPAGPVDSNAGSAGFSHVITGLASGTTYTFTVTATNAVGTSVASVPSNSVTVNASNAPQAYYIHTDHLDTPRVITDIAGNTVWQWDNVDPFGNNMPNENPNGAGQFSFNLRFPGQYFDKETNLNYNVNRDYDPTIGRYIQSDPIGLWGGINTYTYVEGNPLSFIDPLGLASANPHNHPGGAFYGGSGGGGGASAIIGRGAILIGGAVISNASRLPTGSKPIDETPWSGDHRDIKDGVGAGPRDKVWISPDGKVWTQNPDGSYDDHGDAGDYTGSGEASGQRGKDRDKNRCK